MKLLLRRTLVPKNSYELLAVSYEPYVFYSQLVAIYSIDEVIATQRRCYEIQELVS